jgi:thioredoxin 1
MKESRFILVSALCLTALGGGAWALTQERTPPPAKEASSSPEASATQVLQLTAASFPAIEAQDKPVLIDFWASWCGPCRVQGPIVDQVSRQAGDKAVVAKVNVDEEKELAARFGVQAIPTLVVLRRGREVQRLVGVQQAPALLAALEAASR